MGRALTAVLGLATAACVTRTWTDAIIVERGGSTNEKVLIAESIVTQERYDRLKIQLKERFPTLTPRQLEGLSLVWRQVDMVPASGKSTSTVMVIVGIQYDRHLDPKPIIAVARSILELEVNPAGLAPSREAP